MDESQKHSTEWKKPDMKRVYMVGFHLHEILRYAKLICSDRRQISSCTAIDREWGKGLGGEFTKEYSETLGGDRCVYYFDCGNSFMSVDICKSFSNCILRICLVYCIPIISQ